MRRTVITGAGGFLGSALVAELVSHGVEVLAVCPRRGSWAESRLIRHAALSLDQMDRLSADTYGEWDVFYHLAWVGTAGERRKDIRLQFQSTVCAAEAVRAAKALGCHTFIGAGSIMEREALVTLAEPAAAPPPSQIYAAAKLAAHQICEAVAAEEDLRFIWPIITNLYGEGERSTRFLVDTLHRMLKKEPLQFTAATQNYDFLYITDGAAAFRLLGERGQPRRPYVVGSGEARPLREYLMEMRRAAGYEPPLQLSAAPFEGISLPLSAFDTRCLLEDTGFAPAVPFPRGVDRTLRWLSGREFT